MSDARRDALRSTLAHILHGESYRLPALEKQSSLSGLGSLQQRRGEGVATLHLLVDRTPVYLTHTKTPKAKTTYA